MLPSGSLHTLAGAMSEMAQGRGIPWATFVRQRADARLEDRPLNSQLIDGAPEPKVLHSQSTAGHKGGPIRGCLHL
jgi:hypothetical protein